MVPISLYISLWQYLLALLWSGIYNLFTSCQNIEINARLNVSQDIFQETSEYHYIDYDI